MDDQISVKRVRGAVYSAQVHGALQLSSNSHVDSCKGLQMLGPVVVRLQWAVCDGMPTELIDLAPCESLERAEISALVKAAFAGTAGSLGQEDLLTALCEQLIHEFQPLVYRLSAPEIILTIRRMLVLHNVSKDVWLITLATHVKDRALALGLLGRNAGMFFEGR